jgi:hypothetical protein
MTAIFQIDRMDRSWVLREHGGSTSFEHQTPELLRMTPDDLEKIRAEIGKLMAETSKINAEARWYPFVATAGLFAAALGFLKLVGMLS